MESKQKTTRRYSGGQWITETVGKDHDSDSALAAEARGDKARKAMTTGAKPVVSSDEPKDKNSISWLAWKRKQKGRSAHDGAVALATR
jgi:hypothetical protein